MDYLFPSRRGFPPIQNVRQAIPSCGWAHSLARGGGEPSSEGWMQCGWFVVRRLPDRKVSCRIDEYLYKKYKKYKKYKRYKNKKYKKCYIKKHSMMYDWKW